MEKDETNEAKVKKRGKDKKRPDTSNEKNKKKKEIEKEEKKEAREERRGKERKKDKTLIVNLRGKDYQYIIKNRPMKKNIRETAERETEQTGRDRGEENH